MQELKLKSQKYFNYKLKLKNYKIEVHFQQRLKNKLKFLQKQRVSKIKVKAINLGKCLRVLINNRSLKDQRLNLQW